ncbi:putative RiPP precursor [Parafrankia elaeagni]|uniref:putative RiPP precursor n=1 Tax=Parafrankia elaeagni TaxID=222534 RepID=UPI002DDA747E|nr:putative RiPP precursor [Parafrankia elaeagni]
MMKRRYEAPSISARGSFQDVTGTFFWGWHRGWGWGHGWGSRGGWGWNRGGWGRGWGW